MHLVYAAVVPRMSLFRAEEKSNTYDNGRLAFRETHMTLRLSVVAAT